MSPRPLRILSVANVPPDPNSGAAGTVLHTNAALRELGHEVDALWVSDLPARRIRHGNLHSLLEQPRAYRTAVLARLAEGEHDVVQISQPQAYLAARALRRRGFRGIVVNRSHGVELRADAILPGWHRRLGVSESRAPWLTAVMRRLLARQWRGIASDCDGVLVGCEMDREFLCRELGLPERRVVASAHGVAEEFLRPAQLAFDAERARRILHVGQFAFFKGSPLLIRIVDRVLAAEPRAEFTWVCGEDSHEAIRSSFSPGVVERVRLQSSLPLAELVGVHDRHGLFLFPSLFEGFGKAPFEAMARGACVVASDEGGMHDCIGSGRDGWLCAVGDIEAFVTRTLELLRNPELAATSGAAAIVRSRQLTWRACAERAVSFYRQLQHAKLAPEDRAAARAGAHRGGGLP